MTGAEIDGRSKHSRLGIAATAFSTMALLAIAMAVSVFFGIAVTTGPDGFMDDSATDLLGGLVLVGMHALGLCLDILGLGFAIGGLWQGRRKKTFARLGLVLAIFTLLALILSFWGQTSWFSENKYY